MVTAEVALGGAGALAPAILFDLNFFGCVIDDLHSMFIPDGA
ncbi:hypothetical protein [Rhodosalinus sp. FB01]